MYIVTTRTAGRDRMGAPRWLLPPLPGTALLGADPAQEQRTIEDAIQRGTRDENELTNVIFHGRHPERRGRPITAGETGFDALRREWLDIRGRLVRPALATAAGPAPAEPAPATASRPCPKPARVARDFCTHPGTQVCPAIPDLLCVTRVEGAPFVRPRTRAVDAASGLVVVTRREPNVTQWLVPAVAQALSRFVREMASFGMPIEAILTSGSIYCRCVAGTDTLSNHSFGDAIDIAGVRWAAGGAAGSRLAETVVDNYLDPAERRLLVRIGACLRLAFATVIDYHRADHRDHFHCDLNRGAGRPICRTCGSTWRFVQEALERVLGRVVPVTGVLDPATREALAQFARLPSAEALDVRRGTLDPLLDRLFTQVASGG
jgi:hypothetical protein